MVFRFYVCVVTWCGLEEGEEKEVEGGRGQVPNEKELFWWVFQPLLVKRGQECAILICLNECDKVPFISQGEEFESLLYTE